MFPSFPGVVSFVIAENLDGPLVLVGANSASLLWLAVFWISGDAEISGSRTL